jgi:urease accessory protein
MRTEPPAQAGAAPTRLLLFQLISPALPVGAFSYSEGLEVLVQQGRINSAEALHGWLAAELQRGTLGVEAAALAPLLQAMAAEQWSTVHDLDGWLLALREAPEVRAQQRQMGRSLTQLLGELGWRLPAVAGQGAAITSAASASAQGLAWPAAWAWAGHCLGVPSTDLVEAYLYAWVASQISAAVRLVPIGPTQGQGLQLRLAPLLVQRAAELAHTDPHTMWSGGVGAGLAQLGHAELYSRLFRS